MSERIAVISTSYPREPGDAAGHFVRSEVTRWVRAGHEVHVFAPGPQGALWADGARLHWCRDHGAFGWPGALARLKERPARWLGAGAFALRAGRALRAAGTFTRVQAHFLVPSAWPIATRALTPTAPEFEIVGHGSDVRLFCNLPPALRAHITRAWLARGARLRVTSTELAQALRASNPELTPALRVEPSPIDVDGVPKRGAARRALGIPDTAQVAVVVARLIPEKRVAQALSALAWLDDVTAIVVGDGPLLSELRARFPRVRFAGYVPRPEALCFIAAADVLLSASGQEGAPSVVREARALGVKVVAVAAGDLATWAESDSGLFLVEPPPK